MRKRRLQERSPKVPVEENIFFNLTNRFDAVFVTKSFLILFLVFYTVFAFVIYRQIQLMCGALPTPISPLLRFLATIHIGITLAILLGVIGTF